MSINNHKKIFLLVLFLLISHFYCTYPTHNLIDEQYKAAMLKHDSLMTQYSQSREYMILDSAFCLKSKEKKTAFFNLWQAESDSLRNSEDTTVRYLSDIKTIFIDLYEPDTSTFKQYLAIADTMKIPDYNKILGNKKNQISITKEQEINFTRNTTGFPRDAEYIVVQGDIEYRIYADSLFEQFTKDNFASNKIPSLCAGEINNFVPSIHYFDKKVVYCTRKYSLIFDAFFSCRFGSSKAASSKMVWDLSMAKRCCLMPQVEFSTHHWEHSKWHYITFPEIFSINFNSSMDRAKVDFRSSWNSGGSAIYQKENGRWVRKEYNPFTWIE
jgi:hypothetical protein